MSKPLIQMAFRNPWPDDVQVLYANRRPVKVVESVRALDIDACVANECIALMPDLTSVEYVSCSCGRFGQPMLDAVSKMHWLKGLKFGYLTAQSLKPLENLRRLETLTISKLSSATNLQSIASLPELRKLSLGLGRKIDSLEDLSSSQESKIEYLELYGSSDARQPHLRSLAPLGNLKFLRSFHALLSGLDDTDVSVLQSLSLLEHVHIEGVRALKRADADVLNSQALSVKFAP